MSTTWQIAGEKRFPKLKQNITADVAIVGGGLAGIWCAYVLSRRGRKVVVLEKDRLGHGETFYTTAFITGAIDTPLDELVDIFGEEKAQSIWRSGMEAIDEIEEAVNREKIECRFVRLPLIVYAEDKEQFEELKSRDDLASRLGFETRISKGEELPFNNHGAFYVMNQAKYHPMKFLEGLVAACERAGVEFYEHTEVKTAASGWIYLKEEGSVEAENVIIATYDPLNNPKGTRFKKGMYKTYVLELSAGKGSLPEGLYLDMDNPYHYVRVDSLPDKTSILVGGEDHRSELKIDERKNYKALREYAGDLFPAIDVEVVEHWSGNILEPVDGLALIGRLEPHLYVACAFSGNGMTYSAIAGHLIADLISGKGNPYEDLYDPRRRLGLGALFKGSRLHWRILRRRGQELLQVSFDFRRRCKPI